MVWEAPLICTSTRSPGASAKRMLLGTPSQPFASLAPTTGNRVPFSNMSIKTSRETVT
jgi:hypothetical protein